MQHALVVEKVEKLIGDFEIGPITLKLEPGTITALVGDNGAGKSTLLKMIMRLVKKDSGRISVTGVADIDTEEQWKKNVSYMPQALTGVDPFTCQKIKELVSRWYPTWDESFFQHLVQEFDIPLGKKYGKLSQGVQQKLSVAMALAKDTEILLLDEPTSNMDILSKGKLMNELMKWMERGEKTVIVASHQVDDIKKLADYIAFMKKGDYLGIYEKEELIENYKKYWFKEPLPTFLIEGEIARNGDKVLVSENATKTDQHLFDEGIQWIDQQSLDLDEVITFKLT
ncbi:hypothetical protein B4U37_05005 [Sutcliffiella horikoshii]|uniref:ABC transporter domain-containing protein n=1 Tax=Sutcliffiella horikoshii TaxID=79883 RepID=A0ABM6KG45_9BACI|nr:ABC transporter ATP-binding protein [Sutcliffiella horikoshii]ART75441.1 hypothetical protein B4U37_05005 [Sutcliffiella horikoshii]